MRIRSVGRFAEALGGALVLAGLASPGAWGQQQRVSHTVHNLAAGGPGRVRALGEGQVCLFCHAPHTTGGMRPTWNRDVPLRPYRIYESSTLDAKPGQPSGASKLCLSCHDGTIALGNVLSRRERIRMLGGEFMPAGLTNLGTDLSDDHPISFPYTGGLAAADRRLRNPARLPPEVRLDSSGRLQCTACHDPHDNQYGHFLVMSGEGGKLCLACHKMEGWSASPHGSSQRSVAGVAAGADWPYPTVAQNACRSCHVSHGAAARERLLVFPEEEKNCLDCHGGQLAAANIRAELDKRSAHDPRRTQGVHDPAEDATTLRAHVECTDCHDPHSVKMEPRGTGYSPIGATLRGVPGVTSAGAPTDPARREYEVCFRCHGDSPVQTSRPILRQSQTANLRLRFSTSASSYHPVIIAVGSRDTVSLTPDLTPGARIRCTDCHNNDSGPGAGGTGPDGPHGSIHPYLLERGYTVIDATVESAQDYALCYKCHERTSILSDESFPLHRLHVEDEQTPCSACHDPHGVTGTLSTGSDHTHLINFDLSIVRPIRGGRIEFRDRGRFSGTCTLVCHGAEHRTAGYGMAAGPGNALEGGSGVRRLRRR